VTSKRPADAAAVATYKHLSARLQLLCNVIYYIIHAFIMHASLAVILNQRRWQSLGGQHCKGVDGLFEKVSFLTAFEGVESG